VRYWGTGPAQPWADYVERFHLERPGITEALLSRATDVAGLGPYAWLSAALPDEGPILDLGCGSGPAHPLIGRWIGLDRSMAELRTARSLGRSPLLLATASALPVRCRSMQGAIAAMSLMVVDDPPAVLREVSRVLEPGRRLAVLLPTDRPLTLADRGRYGLLLAGLGRTALPFPHPDVVADPAALFVAAGLEIISDDRRRFACALDKGDTDLFVDSLYLPDVFPRRLGLARALVRRWGSTGIGIPLRRLVARTGGGAAG
jgi:SAM-dependent methyltransferase